MSFLKFVIVKDVLNLGTNKIFYLYPAFLIPICKEFGTRLVHTVRRAMLSFVNICSVKKGVTYSLSDLGEFLNKRSAHNLVEHL